MQTQTNAETLDLVGNTMDTVRLPESIQDRSEFERKEELLATVTHRGFKDALTMCSVNMMKTGKANAFAIYKNPGSIEFSDPILAEPDNVRRFGADTNRSWRETTKIDELLVDSSPKKQKLLYEWDKDQDKAVPRKDVLAYIVSFPMGEFKNRGLKAKDIRRPTLAMIDFYLQQEQLHPGFICGILTNDGEQSGLMLFKKSEKVKAIDCGGLGHTGGGDGIDREIILGAIRSIGIVHADINLNCPKNSDPSRLYDKRVARAVEAIF